MKTILLKLMLISTILAPLLASADMKALDHESLLKFLVGKTGAANSKEARTFYFADSYGQVLEIANSKESIQIALRSSSAVEALAADLSGSSDSLVTLKQGPDGESIVQIDSYFMVKSKEKQQRELFSSLIMSAKDVSYPGHVRLAVSAEQKVFWKFDFSNGYSDELSKIRLKEPEVTTIATEANFVLSLTQANVLALSKPAVKMVKEKRPVDMGSCALDSAYLMKCEWSLPTDYTPDTLRGVFSIKDGKIRELLDVSIEPGC